MRVYYRDNGPEDTGTVLRTKGDMVAVVWDNGDDGPFDWYFRHQLVFI